MKGWIGLSLTWKQLTSSELEGNLRDLSARLSAGSVSSEKAVRGCSYRRATGARPLDMTALEDKIVQRATTPRW